MKKCKQINSIDEAIPGHLYVCAGQNGRNFLAIYDVAKEKPCLMWVTHSSAADLKDSSHSPALVSTQALGERIIWPLIDVGNFCEGLAQIDQAMNEVTHLVPK